MNTNCATNSQYGHFLHADAVTAGQGWSVMGLMAPDAHGIIVRRVKLSSLFCMKE